MDNHVLTFLAGVVFLAGFFPYIIAILRRQTKPAKTSWIIWLALDLIVLLGMYAKGSVNGQLIGAVAGATIVTGLALIYGTSGWTKLDKRCLGGAALGIALWLAFDEPNLGIVVSSAVAFMGSWPTFTSAWENPGKEDKLAWTIWTASCVMQLFAIPAWTVQDALQPLTFSVIEFTMVFIIFVRGRNFRAA